MLPDRPGDAAVRRHDRVVHAAACRAGTRSRSPATTSARPARPPQQELAFTLKDGLTYVEQAVERGLDVDDFAPRLSFFFNAQIDFFEEIAKYRAARRIWARELRETFGAREPALVADALPHADRRRLADRAAAAQQHRAHRDRGARRRARRHPVAAHQLLRRGARAADRGGRARSRCARSRSSPTRPASTNTVDPLGGSYFVEALTDEMEQPALRVLRQDRRARRDGRGGQAQLPAARDRRRRLRAAAGDRRRASAIVVGVNASYAEDEEPIPSCASTPRSSASRSAACRPSARARDGAAVERALAALREDAAADDAT